MSKFNTNSLTGKALIATALLDVALSQETDPVKQERIRKTMGVIPHTRAKAPVKCLLDGCSLKTLHNGGCCCAEHRRMRDAQLRGEVVPNGG